jgi:IS5 family transposase
MKGLDYRELEYAQTDSRICAAFIKLDDRKPFSFQMFQNYISRIKASNLQKVLVLINNFSINAGFEDLEKISQDTTVVKTNIHYPTNNSLMWDCIHESYRLLSQLKQEVDSFEYIDYIKTAKKTYFKINVVKSKDVRVEMFNKQLITFTKVINEVSNAIKKKFVSEEALWIQTMLKRLMPLSLQVYDMVYRKEILGENVPNNEKLFSIHELHTDIIVKGSREVLFGHKISLARGKSNLILDCDVLRGNPPDKMLYQPTIERIIDNYNIVPRDSSCDGGYACTGNIVYSEEKGIVNIVFNKVVGSMQNIVSSLSMETRLKKWRSGIEAVISNLKRGFNLQVCNWKGWSNFKAKVLWSVIAYNFRVMTSLTLKQIELYK